MDNLLAITNPLLAGYNRIVESYEDAIPLSQNSDGSFSPEDSSNLKSTTSTIYTWLKKIGGMLNINPSIRQDAEKLQVGFTVSVGLPKISDESLRMLQSLSDKVDSSNRGGGNIPSLPNGVIDEAKMLRRKQVNAKYYQNTRNKRAADYAASKGKINLDKLNKDLEKIGKQYAPHQPSLSPSSSYPQLPQLSPHSYPALGPGRE